MFQNLIQYEKQQYSQFGEDGVTEYLLSVLPVKHRFALEIGFWFPPPGKQAGDECNTRILLSRPDWTVVQIDGLVPENQPGMYREFITARNIGEVMARYGTPREFALFSLDIDGVDYWIWKAVPSHYRPRIVIVEMNAMYGDVNTAKVVPYDPAFEWDGSAWAGASLGALIQLGREKQYTLVHCTHANAFFVPDELVQGYEVDSPQDLYSRHWGPPKEPPPDDLGRPWLDVSPGRGALSRSRQWTALQWWRLRRRFRSRAHSV